MKTQDLKVDLHVHSKMSDRPSHWILQKLSCPESFTHPAKLYQVAKQRGMDLVTITDHNTINGSIEIAHLPDTFVSEEITTYFPEDKCKLHVLALDITEAQHEDISRLRGNVYDLCQYLNRREIHHVLAHPLFDINHKLTLAHFEKMLLLFKNFELNGSRDNYQNHVLESVLKQLCPGQIETLADKHNMKPMGDQFWVKNITGGSDDHSSLNIARMYTVVSGAATKEEFFEGLKQGRSTASGEPATPKTMAHNLYGIAYQYYKSTFKLEGLVDKDSLFQFIDRALTTADPDSRGRSLITRLQDYLISKRPSVSFLFDNTTDITGLIQEKGNAFLAKNAQFRKLLETGEAKGSEKEDIWFHFVSEVSEEIMRTLADTTLSSLSRARLFNIFQTMGSAGSVYTLVAPYFMSYRLFTRDRRFAEACHNDCIGKKPLVEPGESKVALFTDTYHETNGVALTIRTQLEAARKNHKDLSVITCHPNEDPEGAVNFKPIGYYELPEYPELKLYYPPFLKMLDFCFENGITQIHTATPGPVGICALAIAHTLNLPIYGTYHTAFPQYAAELTGDNNIEDLMWKAMIWFYNQMDLVYVPSRATGSELAAKGLSEDRIKVYPRGIDIERFHPDKRNGFWESAYGLQRSSMKMLYVGRVSREKNLGILVRAFQTLEARGKNIDLIIVGDGPYRKDMTSLLNGSRVLFTGELTGEQLACAYASSDIFVFPSTTDTFGNVVLEAQASGLPVVVSDQGGPQENLIPGETGFVVRSFDADAIAEVIDRLYQNTAEATRMKKAARKYMEGRSFEENFLKSWDLFKNPSGFVDPKTYVEDLVSAAC
ncbi:MAG: glycosyltransferase [Desulfobacterales bacterium]|nr:glycosyltransferase [Desulfobacterales bacterium]MBS3809628.1 glycosyltransferase [Desulfobacterales bacterium]